MLSVTNKPLVMLSVTNKPLTLSVVTPVRSFLCRLEDLIAKAILTVWASLMLILVVKVSLFEVVHCKYLFLALRLAGTPMIRKDLLPE
jgi:hypothetical protein